MEFLNFFGARGDFDDADSFETVTQQAFKPFVMQDSTVGNMAIFDSYAILSSMHVSVTHRC